MSQKEAIEKINALVTECDLLIKAGKIGTVSDKISQLNFAQIPRSSRQGLAKICRRAGLIHRGLGLLQPIVRPGDTSVVPATPGEICEYAVLLSRISSIQEAMSLLKSIDPQKTPESLLYLAYCHISNWDYESALEFLEAFLKSSADDYSKLIAQANLASAYVETSRWEQALNLLAETVPRLEQAGATRLVGNCYGVYGQIYLSQGDISKSKKALQQAMTIFGNGKSYDQLLIYKVQANISALEEKSVEPLIKFRHEAVIRNHWPSVRDADFFIVKERFDPNLFDHLVFGTPMPAYRERLYEVGQASERYIFGDQSASLRLDLKTGHFTGAQELNPGKKIHQVLAALLKDFYVPQSLGSLFSDLYPDEFFDINSSLLRVKQHIARTRQWFKENQIPAIISQKHGHYRIEVQGSFGIDLQLIQPALEPVPLKWHELKRAFAARVDFTAEEACRKMNWSRSTFLRLMDWAVKKGKVQKTGIGKSTFYLISPLSSQIEKPKSAA